MRRLATIQKVSAVLPIDGADRIELATVLGWQCVVEKGRFHPGELAVYFEIDSFLPVRQEFEFLRKSSYRKSDFMGEGFRLRTMRFRGRISQGLLLPCDRFRELAANGVYSGMDVTAILGVREWEEPEAVGMGGSFEGNRPSWIPKTSEVRIQSCPDLLREFDGKPYYITTKMDGSSYSLGYRDGAVVYSSHNKMIRADSGSAFVEYCKANSFDSRIKEYAESLGISEFVLQGEWCGPGIQKNRLKLKKAEWFVFTAIAGGERQGLAGLETACAHIGCRMVPIEETGNGLAVMYADVDALLKRADGIGYNGTSREGIVIRPMVPVRSELTDGWLSVKVLSNRYLLKHDE